MYSSNTPQQSRTVLRQAKRELRALLQSSAADGRLALAIQDSLGIDATSSRELVEAWAAGLFDQGLWRLPSILIRERGLPPGVAAAYIPKPEAILLSDDLLNNSDASTLLPYLTEEIGHCIESRLRPEFDTPGDEGAKFASVLYASTAYLDPFEDDHIEIIYKNKPRIAEAANYAGSNTVADTLKGSTSADVLDAGKGSYIDTMEGGAGNDTYTVDVWYQITDTLTQFGLVGQPTTVTYTYTFKPDVVVEASSGGTDSMALRRQEILTLGGATPVNARPRYIMANNTERISVRSYENTAALTSGVHLVGNDLANNLVATSLGDVLRNQAALTATTTVDTLDGGLGNDEYQLITNAAHQIVDSGGMDTLFFLPRAANQRFSAPSTGGIEYLVMNPTDTLSGTGINGTTIRETLSGTAGANVINGGDNNDVIYGGPNLSGQKDTITGGNGNDTFVAVDYRDANSTTGSSVALKALPSSRQQARSLRRMTASDNGRHRHRRSNSAFTIPSGVDIITDFNSAADKILLTDLGFRFNGSYLTTSTTINVFNSNGTTKPSNGSGTHIIYDKSNGAVIYFDNDTSGYTSGRWLFDIDGTLPTSLSSSNFTVGLNSTYSPLRNIRPTYTVSPTNESVDLTFKQILIGGGSGAGSGFYFY